MNGLYVISGAPICGYEIITTIITSGPAFYGIPLHIGSRIGPLYLNNDNSTTLLSLCGKISPLKLIAKNEPLQLCGRAIEISLSNL